MQILKEHPLWPRVEFVCQQLEKNGHRAWLAGGCVRDALLKIQPHDFDIATNAPPERIESLFEKTVGVGKQFGVMVVIIEGQAFEVATFRSDGSYVDGRRPENISFSTPEEDALRRDFTINALFYDPVQSKVWDFVKGEIDISRRVIRAVGDPRRRFTEDKLRILRAVRFVSQLDFEIEAQTLLEIKSMAALCVSVSRERIRDELAKLFIGKSAEKGVALLFETGLMGALVPELDISSKEKLIGDFSMKKSLEQFSAGAFGWWLFFKSLSTDTLDVALRRMKLPNELVSDITRTHFETGRWRELGSQRLAHRARLMNERFSGLLLEAIAFELKCLPNSELQKLYDDLVLLRMEFAELPKPFLNGREIQAETGVRAGPRLGEIIYELQDLQIEKQVTDRQMALQWLKKIQSK